MRDSPTFPASIRPEPFRSIQICRAIAALLVVAHHLGEAIAAPKYFGVTVFQKICSSFGAAGVDFFFVLSGFIITAVHSRDIGCPRRLPEYLYKRLTRIYPIYLIVLVAVALLAFLVPGGANGHPKDLATLLKTLALVPQDPAVVGGTGAPVLIVAWSLQYEMVFYLAFGLLILSRITAAAVLAMGVAWWATVSIHGVPLPFGFLKVECFALFAAGAAVAVISRREWPRWIAPPALAIGAMGFAGTAAIVSLGAMLPVRLTPSTANLAFGAASSLVILGLVTMERTGWRPTWDGAVALGDASYVLYLVHYPIISVACKIAMAAGLAGTAGALLAWATILGLCIVVALLMHATVERPIMTAARRRLVAVRASSTVCGPARGP